MQLRVLHMCVCVCARAGCDRVCTFAFALDLPSVVLDNNGNIIGVVVHQDTIGEEVSTGVISQGILCVYDQCARAWNAVGWGWERARVPRCAHASKPEAAASHTTLRVYTMTPSSPETGKAALARSSSSLRGPAWPSIWLFKVWFYWPLLSSVYQKQRSN
jgi:hypothetical protein